MPPYLLPRLRGEESQIQMKNGSCKRKSKEINQNGRCRSSWSSASQYTAKMYSEPLHRLASLLKHRKCKDIIIMAGAGISTASGIPDFRSPGTGLYYNTKKYNVSSPTDVFDLAYFNRNPHPFLDIIRDFIKSEKRPNVIHGFCKMLETRGLLLRMYTQNIDGLEKKCGISSTRLVEAHGTLDSASCCKCFYSHSPSWTEKTILERKIPSCKRKGCTGYVKPDVVMFGEELPKKFYLYPKDFEKCDLLIIMGTSLNVEPFSELADAVSKKVPRVLINRDAVGPFEGKLRKNDIFIKGDISKSITQVLKLVGWSSGVASENGSSSDISISDTEDKTWASSRIINQVLSQPQTVRDVETLSLPNSVIRKNSDCNIVNKMSILSVADPADKIKSRRSVSAPLPKSDPNLPEQKSDPGPKKIVSKTVDRHRSNERIMISKHSVSDNIMQIQSPPSVAPASVGDPSSWSPQSSSVVSPRSPQSSTVISPMSSQTLSEVQTSLKTYSSSDSTILPTETLSPRSDISPHLSEVTDVKEPFSEDMEKKMLVRSCSPIKLKNMVNVQDTSETYLTMDVLPDDSLVCNYNTPKNNLTSSNGTSNVLPSKATRTPLETENNVVNRNVPIIKSALRRPKPLYKLKKQVQINDSHSPVLQIKNTNKPKAKKQPIMRRKTSNQIIKLNSVPCIEVNSKDRNNRYSNLFTPETSDIFKRELNEFINSRSNSTASHRSNPRPKSAKAAKPEPLGSSPLSMYNKSSRLVREQLNKQNSAGKQSQWRLSTPDRELIARNNVPMFDISKSMKRGKSKKQVILQSKPLYNRDKNNNFQWK